MNKEYYVWSIEHNSWWRANSNGYSNLLSEAGLYTKRQATIIIGGANIARVDECMIHQDKMK